LSLSSDLEIRPLDRGELDLFFEFPGSADTRHPSIDRDYLEAVEQGQYRPEWTWIARRAGRVVARAAWWGFPDHSRPSALDWLDLDEGPHGVADGAALLRRAHASMRDADGARPEYHLFLPPNWRADAAKQRATQDRLEAARAAGLKHVLERLRYRRGAGVAVPDASGGLVLKPLTPALEEDLLRVFEAACHDTLDDSFRREAETLGPEEAARRNIAYLDEMPGPREWWRLAYLSSGELVGAAIPSRNFSTAVIGFIAVSPPHRGHGYARDLLIEATRILNAEGAGEIVADTDLANVPMAAAFEAVGYENFAVRIVLSE
jgi:RimJ/RimL family protein N-acetyltransferase